MKINIKNTEKVQAILDQVNGKVLDSVSVERIKSAAYEIDKKLDGVLPKNQRKRLKITINGFYGELAGKYKYQKQYTYAVLERGGNDWFLVDADRNFCSAGRSIKEVQIWLSKEQKETIKSNLYMEWI